jgi:hypothetical protein
MPACTGDNRGKSVTPASETKARDADTVKAAHPFAAHRSGRRAVVGRERAAGVFRINGA